jgi:hypothetical protein
MLDIGDLTTRLGKIIGGINQANSFRGSSIDTRADTINALYPDAANQREVVDGLYTRRESLRSAMDQWSTDLQALIGTTISTMCRDDSARPKSNDLAGWLDKINRDMVAQAETFDRPAVTGTVAAGTNAGDGYLLATTLDPIDGIASYYSYAEVIRLLCVADSFSEDDTATVGQEQWQVDGETAVSNTSYDWPKGSGSSLNISAQSAESPGILLDPSFESWSGTGNNTPDEWTTVGASGTIIFRGSSSPYSGDYYLQATGDGATAVEIYQEIDKTLVSSSQPYAVVFWVKTPVATLSTAQLRVALVDGSGTVINNNAGAALSQTTNTAGLNAAVAWTRVANVFLLPRNLPSTLRLSFKFTGTLDNAKSVYIDYVTLAPMERVYDGGPYVALISGETPFAINDSFTLTVTNDHDETTFVRALDRFLGLADAQIRLVTDPTGTVLDSLIS